MDVLFALTLSVYEDVIKIHYHENVKLFCQDLVDIALECGWYVDQSKNHYLILKIAIAGPEGRLLFIAFSNPHSMVGIGQIELDETSSPT